jgi:hypothetical protein
VLEGVGVTEAVGVFVGVSAIGVAVISIVGAGVSVGVTDCVIVGVTVD